MIELQLRDEFKGKRLKGTTVDFTNQSQTGALQQNAKDFLRITYPSFDLLKTIEATGPGQSRPLALIGSRGQGKSHLMAALFHLCMNPVEGREWLDQWAHRLGDPHDLQIDITRAKKIDDNAFEVELAQIVDNSFNSRGETRTSVISIGIAIDCSRIPAWERTLDQLYQLEPADSSTETPSELLFEILEAKLQRELVHRKIVRSHGGYDARLIGWLELVGTQPWDTSKLAQVLEEMREVIVKDIVLTDKPADVSSSVPTTLESLEIAGNVDQARALSIRQPHAEAIFRGIKETEFRSVATKIRGRILIYAGLGRYSDEDESEMMDEYGITDVACDDLPRGVALGVVAVFVDQPCRRLGCLFLATFSSSVDRLFTDGLYPKVSRCRCLRPLA